MTLAVQNQPIRSNDMRGRERLLSKPRVSVFRNAGLSPASGAATIVSWDTVEYDTDAMWSSADPTKLACKTAGLFDVLAWGTWAADSTVTRRMLLTRTTSAGVVTTFFNPGAEIAAVGAGLTTTQSVNHHVYMDAGDYVTLTVEHFSSVGAIAFSGATATSRVNGFQACHLSTP